MKAKKILLWFSGTVVVFLVVVIALFNIYLKPLMAEMMKMTTVNYDKNFTVVLGGGGNSGILVSDSIVVVVDSKMDDAAKEFHNQVLQIAGNKPVIIINTHNHPDHINGNSLYKGQTIIAGGNYDKATWIKEGKESTLPTKWVKDSLNIRVGDEMVTIYNIPFPAHTKSDVLVYLRNRKVLFTGDVVLNHQCPALISAGATSKGYLDAMNLMQRDFDIKTVVPGHGKVGGSDIIDSFQQYFVDMKEAAINEGVKEKMIDKYKSYFQVPFIMNTESSINFLKKEINK